MLSCGRDRDLISIKSPMNIEALLRTFPSATYTAQPCYVLAPQFPKVLLKASCNGQLKPTKIGAEWQ